MSKNQLINIDAAQIKYVEQVLKNVKNGANKAIKNGINNSISATKSTLFEAIKNEYALKGSPKKLLDNVKPKRASPSDLTATIPFKGLRLSLMNFKVNPRDVPSQKKKAYASRKRVTTEIRFGKQTTWNHAFLVSLGKGRIGMFERKGKFNHKRYWANKKNSHGNIKSAVLGREDMRKLMSTSVPQMIKSVLKRNAALNHKLDQIVEGNIDEQVEKLLAKASK